MDATAQLALMTKAKLVFETPATFLSFPVLTPLSYQADQLNFAQPVPELDVLAEFSQLTNALPGGVSFAPTLGTALWDVYHCVLQEAQVAAGSLTPEQQSSYEQAEALLWVQGPDGLPAPSAAATAYRQYQHVYDNAVQTYRAAQLTAAASSDPNVAAQWQNTDGPQVQAQVQAALDDWATKGFKAQIEQARQVELSCISQSPVLRWNAWQSACVGDIDLMTDAHNQSFAPTTFAPFDILDQPNWPNFSISNAELNQLLSQAPPELATALGVSADTASSVTSLAFEFCSVSLARPWLAAQVFDARFWRFSDPNRMLCDGNTPPHGEWPAYVTGLVFARNIVATQQSAAGAAVAQPVPSLPPFAFHHIPFRPPIFERPAGGPGKFARPEFAVRARADLGPPVAEPGTAAVSPAASVVLLRPTAMERINAFSFAALPQPAAAAPTSAAPAAASSTNDASASNDVSATDTAPAPANTAPAASPTPSPALVSILAFICTPLPKCPNPDPALTWDPAPAAQSPAAPGPQFPPAPAPVS